MVRQASAADAIVLCLGEESYTEKPGDIDDLALPWGQAQLANDLLATGKKRDDSNNNNNIKGSEVRNQIQGKDREHNGLRDDLIHHFLYIRSLRLSNPPLLFSPLCPLGKPVVLVLVEGRPRLLHNLDKTVPAIVHAYLPGPVGGRAVAEVLLGKVKTTRLLHTYLHVLSLYMQASPSSLHLSSLFIPISISST